VAEAPLPYTSAEGGLSFAYPLTYTLVERSDGFEDKPVRVITLIPKDAAVPDMSEGPILMSIIVADNTEGLPLEEWVRSKSISNFSLSADKVLSPITVADAPALSYQHSGLYEFDAVAALRNGRVYIFSVAWLTADDQIRKDFQTLLKSVSFTP